MIEIFIFKSQYEIRWLPWFWADQTIYPEGQELRKATMLEF